MNEKAMNGMENPARPVAILAMVVLCLSLTIFFHQFTKHFEISPFWKFVIRVLGTLSMVFAVLIFTRFHDIMTTISSAFGVLVVVGIIITLYKSKMTFYKTTGILCIVLLGVNNLIYYSGNYIVFLPIIQKLTFVLVLSWVVGLSLLMRRQNEKIGSY